MLFLTILIPATAIAWVLGRRSSGWRDHARRGLAAAMIVAGITHFTKVDTFVQHLPDWVPSREIIVYLTGVIEIILGGALLFAHAQRKAVGRLVAAYLLAVLPANIYVAVSDVDVTGQPGGAHAWIRLPLQALFIAWALVSTAPSRSQHGTAVAEPAAAPTQALQA